MSKVIIPHELEIVLNGPIGPQRLRDDTIVVDSGGWYRTLTPSATYSAANEILFSNLDKIDTDAHIDAIFAEYSQHGLPFSWCVYPWTQPPDLGDRLVARGATASSVRAYLVDTSLPLKVVDGVEVERVHPGITEGFEAYINILSSGYVLPADEEAFRRIRYHQLIAAPNPMMHIFIARCNGVSAGCIAMIVKEDSAHLTSSSVLPAFQGRGVFQSLNATALATLRDMGIALATGHANDQSAFWVERFGFRLMYAYTIYEVKNSSLIC